MTASLLRSIWIGFDSRPAEVAAFAVARHSIRRHMTQPIPVMGLVLSELQRKGLYTRPIEWRASAADKPIMWDVISDAPMSTEHANARFLVPRLAKTGWALFMDGDMLVRSNIARVFDRLDGTKAIYCVQHQHVPTSTTKMDGQIQTAYSRKNQSSFVLFNCDHPSNRKLTLEMINAVPGRELHRFCWLEDREIGTLEQSWNFLVGHSDPEIVPDVVHFTDGLPSMLGFESVAYADEWRDELNRWAA